MNDPGKDVDVYFTSSVKTMADIWMGENSYRKTIGEAALTVVGNKALTRNIPILDGQQCLRRPATGE